MNLENELQNIHDFSIGLKKLAESVAHKSFIRNSAQISDILKLSMLIQHKIVDKQKDKKIVISETKELIAEKLKSSKENIDFAMDYLKGDIPEDYFETKIFLDDIHQNITFAKNSPNPMKAIKDFSQRLHGNILESKKEFLGERRYIAFEEFITDLETSFDEGFFKENKDSIKDNSSLVESLLKKHEDSPLALKNIEAMYALALEIGSKNVVDLIKKDITSEEIKEMTLQRFKILKVNKKDIFLESVSIFDDKNGVIIKNKFDFEQKSWISDFPDELIILLHERAKDDLKKAINKNNLADVISCIDLYSSMEINSQYYLDADDIKEVNASISYIADDKENNEIKDYLNKLCGDEINYTADLSSESVKKTTHQKSR